MNSTNAGVRIINIFLDFRSAALQNSRTFQFHSGDIDQDNSFQFYNHLDILDTFLGAVISLCEKWFQFSRPARTVLQLIPIPETLECH